MNSKQAASSDLLNRLLDKTAEARQSLISAEGENAQKSGFNQIADKGETDIVSIEQAQSSIQYLDSDEAAESMSLDPYWPKWNSPWWHMTLLYEMNLARLIPPRSLQLLIKALDQHYLHFFPYTENEIPAGYDPVANVVCHCALGTAHRILLAAGTDIEQQQPWIRPWLLKYQLPDGGFNCDEAVYTKSQKSSVVSTIHFFESLLATKNGALNQDELACLDRMAEYLLQRRFFRSLSKEHQVINEDWTKLTFPRFYEYDILRGLSSILKWSLMRNKVFRWETIEEVVALLDNKCDRNGLKIERQFYASCQTRIKNPDGSWSKQAVSTFPLLLHTGKLGSYSQFLTQKWYRAIEDLKQAEQRQLISF